MNAAVFKNCNVCGRTLAREDELACGVCAICANEEVPAKKLTPAKRKRLIVDQVERLRWIEAHPHASPMLQALAKAAADAIEKMPPIGDPEMDRLVVATIQASLISWLRYQRSRSGGYPGEFCSYCGCTEDYACLGGCSWDSAPPMRSVCTVCADARRAR